MSAARVTLTLGPVLFNWPAEHLREFYARIADEAPVDHVCVGEIVCSRRQPFLNDVLPDVIDRLERAGKNVLVSSLALPTLERELLYITGLGDGPHMVEVNDISALRSVGDRPHAIGPFVNVYNEDTAAFLASRGAVRIALPPELPEASIRAIAAAVPGAAIEVWAFGRIPLAISARCYHARLNGRTKDSCQFVCAADPDGLEVATIDGQKFLAVNGVQTLSYAYAALLNEAAELARLGVASLRLSPQTCDMVAVARCFRDVLDARLDPEEATAQLRAICTNASFANGFVHGRSGAQYLTE
jgi:collagenase-like PrtC family protease